ncbi:MAG: DUF4198 domain-containing protein [Bryobacteraceae bacterium]
MKSSFILTLLAATLAQAHFVFVVPQPGGASASVLISETLEPDLAVDAALVSGAKLSLRGSNGKDVPLVLAKSGSVYAVPISGSGLRVIHGVKDSGITLDADKKPYLLVYHPKTILGDAFDAKATIDGSVPLELVPQGKPGAMAFLVFARGKPLADAEVTVILPDGKMKPVKTDKSGRTEVFAMTGRYGAWVRFFETTPGEREGKKYGEVHHYATLVADVPGAAQASAK